MSAKPRMTVRLAPSTLHQLAWLAARRGIPPAELARICLTSWCQRMIADEGKSAEWYESYRAWLDEKGAAAPSAESPRQADYDGLAQAGLVPSLPKRTAAQALAAAGETWAKARV